jgi:predicted transcriptional regulator
MSHDNIITFYEEVKEDIKFQGISQVRMKIMLILKDGPKKTKQLRKLTEIQSSTIIHGINELEKQNIVSRDGDNYYLTEIGQILILKLVDMIKTMVSLKNHQKLWINHEINAIPLELLMEIGDLSDSNLVEANNIDIFKVKDMFLDMVQKSSNIKGVSTIFHPDFIETFKNILDNKEVKVELILNDAILKKTIKSINPNNLKDFLKLSSKGNLDIWILNEEARIAFTVTEKYLSLGLFTKGGGYDSSKDLFSENPDAIAWANKLFEYYRKKSDKIELKRLDKLISHLI